MIDQHLYPGPPVCKAGCRAYADERHSALRHGRADALRGHLDGICRIMVLVLQDVARREGDGHEHKCE